jgi:hypothetical protein
LEERKMSSAKEHFRDSMTFHKAAGEHHAGCAKDCHALADLHDGDVAKCFTSLGKGHEALSKDHLDHASRFESMHSKAVSDELGKARAELAPTRVSGVTPTPPGVTAVPSAGQKPIPTPQENPIYTEVFGNTQESEL